ncbi:hypothetical protein TNCV_1684011 [Trichonephila clavipes]|nr:hypothetical protein TNCV_1684011 [Trichonephila clavipes]
MNIAHQSTQYITENLFLVRHHIGGYPSPQVVLTPSFHPRGKHLRSDDDNLYYDLGLPRASLGIFYMPYDMTAVDFCIMKTHRLGSESNPQP